MRRLIPHLVLATLTVGAACAALLPSVIRNATLTAVTLDVKQCGPKAYAITDKTITVRVPSGEVGHLTAYGLPFTSEAIISPASAACAVNLYPLSSLTDGAVIQTQTAGGESVQSVTYVVVKDGGTIPSRLACYWPSIQSDQCASTLTGLISHITEWGASHALYAGSKGHAFAKLQFGAGKIAGAQVTYLAQCEENVKPVGGNQACETNLDVLAQQFVNS
jgi:hypothetical protein